jgi:hypothetical protein
MISGAASVEITGGRCSPFATHWTDDALLSRQPSASHAREATMKITRPATVMRAFQMAATSAAVRTVVTAANVLKIHEFFHSATRHNRLVSWARITISWRAPLGAEEHVPDNSHSKHHKYQADRQEKQN